VDLTQVDWSWLWDSIPSITRMHVDWILIDRDVRVKKIFVGEIRYLVWFGFIHAVADDRHPPQEPKLFIRPLPNHRGDRHRPRRTHRQSSGCMSRVKYSVGLCQGSWLDWHLSELDTSLSYMEEALCWEIRAAASTGGGRGVFATKDVGPGTLLMAEKAFFVLDTGEASHVALARRVIGGQLSPHATTLFANLHPVVLTEHEVDFGEKQHAAALDELMVQEASSGLTRAAMLRILLAVQFNSFASGLYHDQAMVNHSCAPNAVKLTFPHLPPGQSFVFATRAIAKGYSRFFVVVVLEVVVVSSASAGYTSC
jgi:hypothetical protein